MKKGDGMKANHQSKMDLVELLTVADHFQIEGRGVVGVPDFVPPDGWRACDQTVLILTPESRSYGTSAGLAFPRSRPNALYRERLEARGLLPRHDQEGRADRLQDHGQSYIEGCFGPASMTDALRARFCLTAPGAGSCRGRLPASRGAGCTCPRPPRGPARACGGGYRH